VACVQKLLGEDGSGKVWTESRVGAFLWDPQVVTRPELQLKCRKGHKHLPTFLHAVQILPPRNQVTEIDFLVRLGVDLGVLSASAGSSALLLGGICTVKSGGSATENTIGSRLLDGKGPLIRI
jgi:hypothetical protein